MSMFALLFFGLGMIAWWSLLPIIKPIHQKGIMMLSIIALVMIPLFLSSVISNHITQDFFWSLASGIFFGDFVFERWTRFKLKYFSPSKPKSNSKNTK